MAMGYALANSMLIEAPDGAIIVDVTESMKSGARAFAALREVSKSPVKAIIYTHNHADHVFGAKVRVAVSKTKVDPVIWCLAMLASSSPTLPKEESANPLLFLKFPGNPMELKRNSVLVRNLPGERLFRSAQERKENL